MPPLMPGLLGIFDLTRIDLPTTSIPIEPIIATDENRFLSGGHSALLAFRYRERQTASTKQVHFGRPKMPPR